MFNVHSSLTRAPRDTNPRRQRGLTTFVARTRRCPRSPALTLRVSVAAIVARCRHLHRDEGGAISMISVFAILLLTMLLGMVMNVGRHVDQKVKMQNAADASAMAGGLVMARSMNTLAFTNHLLCDVFALTAYMREARDRTAESMVPDVLAAWDRAGQIFTGSQFQKFATLGRSIQAKTKLEQRMVTTFGEWASASSEMILPVLEEILSKELIPEFQRALVKSTPQLVQLAASEVAKQHGECTSPRLDLQAEMWRTLVDPVGGMSEDALRTVPVVDPVLNEDSAADGSDFAIAVEQRRRLAHHYLNDWNNRSMEAFDHHAKMSRFSSMWRGFTCGQLEKLLNVEYPDRNLLHVIRTRVDEMADTTAALDQEFTFVGVVYGPHVREVSPGLFRNPVKANAVAFAQVMVFIPRPRLVRVWYRNDEPKPQQRGPLSVELGGVPGQDVNLPLGPAPPPPRQPAADDPEWDWSVVREHTPTHWNLLNQYWTVKLVPATTLNIAAILQGQPPSSESPT